MDRETFGLIVILVILFGVTAFLGYATGKQTALEQAVETGQFSHKLSVYSVTKCDRVHLLDQGVKEAKTATDRPVGGCRMVP